MRWRPATVGSARLARMTIFSGLALGLPINCWRRPSTPRLENPTLAAATLVMIAMETDNGRSDHSRIGASSRLHLAVRRGAWNGRSRARRQSAPRREGDCHGQSQCRLRGLDFHDARRRRSTRHRGADGRVLADRPAKRPGLVGIRAHRIAAPTDGPNRAGSRPTLDNLPHASYLPRSLLALTSNECQQAFRLSLCRGRGHGGFLRPAQKRKKTT